MFLKNKRGFTLIELLVIISIIGLISSFALISLDSARKKSRDAKQIADLKQMQTALELYFDDKGYYPYTIDCSVNNESGWVYNNGSIAYSPDGIVRTWSDLESQLRPYMSKLPKLANHGYGYGATKKSYKLTSVLELDTMRMQNDGGCYPRVGTGCNNIRYEVWGGNGGFPENWTCISHMCAGY